MTFTQFCSKVLVPFDLYPIFCNWLGSTSGCKLPEREWEQLWSEFVATHIGSSNNHRKEIQ